ncbi:MAG: hypothetical protein ABIG90_03685 [bacterium]
MIISRKDNIIKIRAKEASVEIGLLEIKIDDFVINSPGEYEIKNIFVEAINPEICLIMLENTRICCLNKSKLTDKELEKIGNIDILLADNKDLASEIEPSLVILKKDIDKISIKKSDLPKEGTKIWKP